MASALLLLAHAARAARMALLFPPKYLSKRFNLLLGLSIGYAVNAVLPWRLGEVARAWFVSQRDGVRFPYSAAVVVAERLSDVVVVALAMLAVAAVWETGFTWLLSAVMLASALALVIFAAAVKASARARRIIWWSASVFNDRVRFGIADFCWSLSELVTGGALLTRSYVLASARMWLVYLASYSLFAWTTGGTVLASVALLLGSPLQPVIGSALEGDGPEAAWLLLFTSVPVAAVMLYGSVKQGALFVRILRAQSRFGLKSAALGVNAHDRFRVSSEYEYFLVSLFGGDNQAVQGFGLKALDDGVVHRLFAGGSDAITALVEVDGELVIRKFAAGEPGDKLKTQASWLAGHVSTDLPLVDIVRQREGEGFFLYDMPLVVPANDFYDIIHTSPVSRSKALLSQVGERIHAFHTRSARADAEPGVVAAYLEGKAIKNARAVLEFAHAVLPGPQYTINGRAFSLATWDRLLDPAWLMTQVKDRSVTTVHGDLTVENIIVAPDRPPGWYIIDPNSENIFDSGLIDWAKLMQSLHLGYEGLNRNVGCTLSGDAVMLSVTKSAAYSELHNHLESLIIRLRGAERLREVYFHELVNYLRLTPYKIRQNPQKGLCFFACTSVLLDRYLETAG